MLTLSRSHGLFPAHQCQIPPGIKWGSNCEIDIFFCNNLESISGASTKVLTLYMHVLMHAHTQTHTHRHAHMHTNTHADPVEDSPVAEEDADRPREMHRGSWSPSLSEKDTGSSDQVVSHTPCANSENLMRKAKTQIRNIHSRLSFSL